MIVERKDFKSNAVRIISILVDVFLALVAILLLVLAIIGQLKQNRCLFIISTIFWICGVFSIGDFIMICRWGQPIVNFLYIKFKFHYKKYATLEQKRILDSIFANSNGAIAHIPILIFGKPYSGKSESVNFIIDYILHNLILHKTQLLSGYEYIDCYNDASVVSNHINKIPLYAFNNRIIIFDNINEADGSMTERLKEICNQKNCCVLVIEENSESILQKLMQDNVGDSLIEFQDYHFSSLQPQSLSSTLKALSGDYYTLNILLTIAVLSRYHNICNINEIKKLSQLHGKQFLKLKVALRKLAKLNLIEVFPINSSYYRINRSISSDKFLFTLFPFHKLRDEKLIKYRELFFNDIGDEILWLNLLDLPDSERKKYSFSDHLNLFSFAIVHANFIKLNNALQEFYTRNNNNCEFLYEEGFLNYVLNNFTKAISCFENLLLIDISNKLRYEFKLIETLHGSCEETIVKKVILYIKDLLSSKELSFQLYGKYWINHMASERGYFNIDSLNYIRKSLIDLYNGGYNDELILSVIERCFMDQLRMYWMTGTLIESQNKQLQKEFEDIFSSKSNYNYYILLYFKAGFYHYHSVCASFLKNGNNAIEEPSKCAKVAYEAALANDYQKLKSKAATSVKLVDLKAIFNDAEYKDLIQEVKRFRQDAEKNRIDVFIAFSDSLIGKLLILDYCISNYSKQENVCVTNKIDEVLNNSENIYNQFKNQYGIMRVKILKGLYKLLLSFSYDNNAINEAKIELKSIPIQENWLIEKTLVASMNCSNLRYKDVCDCIKFYPMILQ